MTANKLKSEQILTATDKPRGAGNRVRGGKRPAPWMARAELSWMTSFASFRSDPVSCAGTIQQLAGLEFTSNLNGTERIVHLPD
ncbi:hypothetical protein CBF17_007020 [Pantoea agglomerans]|nr:hypothetical protein CBF17_007020 [Pantoea agglomerans]